MKKIMALLLLIATTSQASELKKAWDNFGKDNRTISSGKAVGAGFLSYFAAKNAFEQLKDWSVLLESDKGWLSREELYYRRLDEAPKYSFSFKIGCKAEALPRYGALVVISSYAALLFLRQALQDAKHALGEDKKAEEVPTLPIFGLVEEWRNLGADKREVSAAKALLAGGIGYAAFKELFLTGWKVKDGKRSLFKFLKMGICASVSFVTLRQAWHDAKLALGKKKRQLLNHKIFIKKIV